MNGFDLSTVSGIYMGSRPISALYLGNLLIYPRNYKREYFNVTSLTSNNNIIFELTSSKVNNGVSFTIQVSTDKENWTSYTLTASSVGTQSVVIGTLGIENKLYIKGENNSYYISDINSSGGRHETRITTTGSFYLSGNIMSLIYGDNYLANQNRFPVRSSNTLQGLFRNNGWLIDISELYMPATTLSSNCYASMFEGCTSLTDLSDFELPATSLYYSVGPYQAMFKNCTSLTTLPELPATTLASNAYEYMFQGCTSLTDLSDFELPATTLTNACYHGMFYGCTSLTKAPSLPATTLANYCYHYMFESCTSLMTAPELPATTLPNWCYSYMFHNCTSLTTAPELSASTLSEYCCYCMFSGCSSLVDLSNFELPATTLAESCYSYMFGGCASLTDLSNFELPATTLVEDCYYGMFSSCSSLIATPELPATTLANSCYRNMFYGCTSLTTAPELPATTLAQYCYQYMFQRCTSLTTAPELPATTLAPSCYSNMFRDCTSLTTAPELPAATLANYCYNSMFWNCTSLNYIKCLATDISANNCTSFWVYGVSSTGTFFKDQSMSSWTRGIDGIPANWTVYDSVQYSITISQTTNGTVTSNVQNAEAGDTITLTVTPDTGYELDTLTVLDASSNPVTVTNNQFTMPGSNVTVSATFALTFEQQYFTIESLEDNNEIQFYKRSSSASDKTIQWSTDGTTWNSYTSSTSTTTITTLNTGDKMMIKGTNTQYAYDDTNNTSHRMSSTKTINVYGNIMSLLYGDNFVGQTELTAPYTFRTLFWQGNIVDASNLILPATTLTQYCYKEMFDGNTSLIATPKVLPAMTLTNNCYLNMFIRCTSLTSVPIDMLPATTLAPYCYQGFLANCTQLVNSPELPASNLANYCYQSMYQGCTNLKSIICLATNISATRALFYWTYQVGSGGTFTKKSGVSYSTGISGIPSGWTVVDV